MGAAPPDTGAGMAVVGTAPGTAAPVVPADSATSMDIDTAGDLFVDDAVFASASVWGDGGDEITAAIPPAVDSAPGAATPADHGATIEW